MCCEKIATSMGSYSLLVKNDDRTAKTFSIAMQIAQELGILKQGDLVVQTAGTLTGISGSTDLIKVGLVRKVVTRGISIGELGAVSYTHLTLPTTPYV